MQAWVIKDKQLHLENRKAPTLGPEEVQVAVQTIGVNRADILQTQGMYPAPQGVVADIPGLEYSGVISAVGEKVQQRQVGDKVMGLVAGGAYSEYICSHEAETLIIPDGVDMVAAATIPEAFLTAYRAIYVQAGLAHGQSCLIRPATSGVGLAAVQLCHAFGNPSFGSSRKLENLDTAQQWGLTNTVIENDQMTADILTKTNQQGVDVIFDMVGPDWDKLLPALAVEGQLVMIGFLGGTQTSLNLLTLLQRRQHLSALTMRHQPLQQRLRNAQFFNQRLVPYFEQNKLQPLPHKAFPFAEAPSAHQHMLSDDFSGKRVISLI